MEKVKVFSALGFELEPTIASRCRRWIKEGKASPCWRNGSFCVKLNDVTSIDKERVMAIDETTMLRSFGIDNENPVAQIYACQVRTYIKDSIARRVMKTEHCKWQSFIVCNIDKDDRIRFIHDINSYLKSQITMTEIEERDAYFRNNGLYGGYNGKIDISAFVVSRRGAVPDKAVDGSELLPEVDWDRLKKDYGDSVIIIPTFEIATFPSFRINVLASKDGLSILLDSAVSSACAIRREEEINTYYALKAASEKRNIKTENLCIEDLQEAFTMINDVKHIVIGAPQYNRLREEALKNPDKNYTFPALTEYDKHPKCVFKSDKSIPGIQYEDPKEPNRGVDVGSFYGAKFQVISYDLENVIFTGEPDKVGLLAVRQDAMSFVQNEYPKLRCGVVNAIEIGIMTNDKHIARIDIKNK